MRRNKSLKYFVIVWLYVSSSSTSCKWLGHNSESVNYPCSYTAFSPDLWEHLTVCCTVDLVYLHTLQSKLIKDKTNATVIAPTLTLMFCSLLSSGYLIEQGHVFTMETVQVMYQL